MSSTLFGVDPDFGVLSVVTLALCLIAALACYIPWSRARNIDPLIALRDE